MQALHLVLVEQQKVLEHRYQLGLLLPPDSVAEFEKSRSHCSEQAAVVDKAGVAVAVEVEVLPVVVPAVVKAARHFQLDHTANLLVEKQHLTDLPSMLDLIDIDSDY